MDKKDIFQLNTLWQAKNSNLSQNGYWENDISKNWGKMFFF